MSIHSLVAYSTPPIDLVLQEDLQAVKVLCLLCEERLWALEQTLVRWRTLII